MEIIWRIESIFGCNGELIDGYVFCLTSARTKRLEENSSSFERMSASIHRASVVAKPRGGGGHAPVRFVLAT
jgi:hypothetical protein